MILLSSAVPVFASNETRKGKLTMYYDMDGQIACCNFVARSDYRACAICKNCCVTFVGTP